MSIIFNLFDIFRDLIANFWLFSAADKDGMHLLAQVQIQHTKLEYK